MHSYLSEVGYEVMRCTLSISEGEREAKVHPYYQVKVDDKL